MNTNSTSKLTKEDEKNSLEPLSIELTKANIQHKLRLHKAYERWKSLPTKTKEKLNMLESLSGKHQITIPTTEPGESLSIIKGDVSFGMYEIYGGSTNDPEFPRLFDCNRYQTIEEVVNALKGANATLPILNPRTAAYRNANALLKLKNHGKHTRRPKQNKNKSL